MNEKLKYKIRSAVEKLGLEQAREMFGKDIIKQVYIDNPSSFLNQFNNLKSVERDDKIFYVDNDSLPLFMYYKDEQESKNGYYYINYYRIWSFFESYFVMEYTEIKDLISVWLGETYNLRGFTPNTRFLKRTYRWERPII